MWDQKPLQACGGHPGHYFTGTQTAEAPCWSENQKTECGPTGKSAPRGQRWVLFIDHSSVLLRDWLTNIKDLNTPGSALEIGPVMGIVFLAFVMGVGLMGGLWSIYNYTGNEISFRFSVKSYSVKYITSSHPYVFCLYFTLSWFIRTLENGLSYETISTTLVKTDSTAIWWNLVLIFLSPVGMMSICPMLW